MGTLYKRQDSDLWWITYVDHLGARKRLSTKTSDKSAAKSILHKLESDEALRSRGVINAQSERIGAQLMRSIADHTKEFRASLETHVNRQSHINEVCSVVDAIIAAEGWRALQDITVEGVERHVAKLRKAGRSNRTQAKHISHIRQFVKWAIQTDRMQMDPLKTIRKPSSAKDRKLVRRALLPDEWPLLRKATLNGGVIKGMPADHRALMYELAIQTGLRQNEVRSLTVGKFHLSHTPPFVLLPSSHTKNAKPARQYITQSLSERLKDHLKKIPPGGVVFQICDPARVAKVIRADLEAARIAWIDAGKTKAEKAAREKSDFLKAENAEGEGFDFHCLRHTCGAWLAARGENPKTIQTIMRHSSITLTMDTYGHLFPAAESEAIQRLEGVF